jgi:outer membrane receptor protein involved in Fe transport
MNLKQQLLISLFLLTGLSLSLKAQSIQIEGTIVESNAKKPIEFATVMLLDTSDQILTGATTDLEGKFKIQTEAKAFYLQIKFMGYQEKILKNLKPETGKLELGEIILQPQEADIDEVVVQAEKSQLEFKLDKRVFNVGQDLSSSGASALEVLENVPAVDVNIEGQVSLRGSQGVQILINGKPSVIASDESNALGSITADMIEKVEVITNPSAKYEAEGTAGIINIVLKKEDRKGTNGSFSLNTGWPHNHSAGLSIGHRREKLNIFSQMGVGYRSLPRYRRNINQNYEDSTILNTNGIEYRNEFFVNGLLGADFNINDYNVITLTGTYAYEAERQPSRTDFSFTDADGNVDEWYRTESTIAGNPKWQYELQYKKNFKSHEDHVLIFSALGNFFGKELEAEFEDRSISGDREDMDQRTATAFEEAKYTFNLDYTLPINKFTLEAGAQYVLQNVSNNFRVEDLMAGDWVVDSNLTNLFFYDQGVLGLYSTGAYEADKWGVKLGLRMEYTDLRTFLANTGEENIQQFPNLFPSFHTSYKFSNRFSIQAGYSRRIFRPRLWDLNPFFNIRNNFAIRQGNPNLLPEYTDSYEINAISIFEKLTFNLGAYFRYTTAVVERISTFQNNVVITMPLNIGTTKAGGLEFYLKYEAAKWLSLNTDANFFFFRREGEYEGVNFDFDAFQWSANLTSKFKLPHSWDIELRGEYQSAQQTIQGVQSANLFANLGVRKKFGKGRYVMGLSVRDIFASRFRENILESEDFYIYSFGQRGRFITLNFSYAFGKGEAMQYSGRLRR